MKKEVCVIVDGFSTGSLLASEIKKTAHDCVHVISNKNFYKNHLKKDSNQYLETIFFNDSFGELFSKLKKYEVLCAIPGIEGNSIYIADKINKKYMGKSNDIALSEARRNKYLMSEILYNHKLQAINSIKVSSIEDVIKKHIEIEKFPKVIKPIASGGSQDVHICHSQSELINAFNLAIGRLNECGIKNNTLLIQPYIDGKEYFINTTSCNGNHYINDAWVYIKQLNDNNEPICLGSELLQYKGLVEDKLSNYCFKILDALGIINGPAHIEVIIQNGKPYFIELGARLMGGAIPNIIFQESLSYTQLDATIDCFINPENFIKKTSSHYQIEQYLKFINVNANNDGVFSYTESYKKLISLSSFCKDFWLVKQGQAVRKTIDDLTSIGLIILQNKDKEILEKDFSFVNKNLNQFFSIKES